MGTISDKELWACANTLVEQHGRRAVIHAGTRMCELVDQGDQEGADTWLLILERIVTLLGGGNANDNRKIN